MTPVWIAGGTSPNDMTTGDAPQASSMAFSAGPMLRIFLPSNSSGAVNRVLAPAPMNMLRCAVPSILMSWSLANFSLSALTLSKLSSCSMAPGVVSSIGPATTFIQRSTEAVLPNWPQAISRLPSVSASTASGTV